MKLLQDWKLLVRKAWSLRLMAVAAVLSGLEAVVPLTAPWLDRRTFALIMFGIVAAAFVARLLAQKGVTDEHTK